MCGFRQFSTVLLLVAATGLASIAAAAEAEDPPLQQLAAQSYAMKYPVGLEEATRRMVLQDRASGIDDDLTALLGDDFAGMWFDSADRGRLKIGLTRAGSARGTDITRLIARYALGEEAQTVPVRFSLAELTRKQDSIRESLAAVIRAGHALTSYNPRLNSVVIETLNTLPAAEETLVRQAAAQEGVTVHRTNATTLVGQTQSCIVNFCDPPLRGGRFMDGCTAGFMARHNVNTNHILVLTAGHCIAHRGLSSVWATRDEAQVWHNIGAGYGYTYAGAPGRDAGVIFVNPAGFWGSPGPVPRVVVKDSPLTTYDPNYKIKKDSGSTLGQWLCYTGGRTGTHCAEVSDLGSDFVTEENTVLKNLGELDICESLPGDSGSPIYKAKKAHGLLIGGIDSTFHCLTAFQGVRGAQAGLNISILLSP
ncbi:MAG TPA: hypothetical protein VMF58_07095 [Rhizomicrobium sp.]|nr:hypothetical protein [Rhizomicrobium sp.]